jgi:thiol-disulfide isomerase/thioredoxin
MKKITILLVLSSLTLLSFSQSIFNKQRNTINDKTKKDYKISGEVTGLQDSTVMLAYYFGGKQYATDTANVIAGRFTFEGDKELKGGMYLVVLSESKYFDLIVSEQHFSFSTKLDNLVGAMTFTNSKENPPFYEYLNFITEMQKQVTPIRQQLETAEGVTKTELKIEAQKIDSKVKAYRTNFLTNNSDKFFSKIVMATTEIEIPESPLDSAGNPDKSFPYRFYKKHFWDNIDFSDERMLRTPIFFNKMDQYLDKLTAKHPDSINISADILVEKSRANTTIFQYVVSYITSNYERSKIMGMDAVFVHMVENYYITNQCTWVDSTELVKIADRAQKIAPNLIGRKASEFHDFYGRPFMKDTLGIVHTLNEINADYTVLVFFGPTCGHCKKEMPKIKYNLDSLISAGYDIETFAVATEFDKKEWKKFINDQETGDWINVADINHDDEGNPVASSDWRDKYDIYSTPVIYLLDKEKKIIAKRITHKQIVEIITRLAKN